MKIDAFGIFKRLLSSAVEDLSQSFYDDFGKENAKTRAKAGIKPTIIRKDDGKCCEWCSKLSGSYTYGDQPDDIYRRHRNCSCTVVVQYSKSRYEDVWTKKELESEKEARKERIKEMEDLDKLSHQEKIERRAQLDREYSRQYRKNMTAEQRAADNARRREAYRKNKISSVERNR